MKKEKKICGDPLNCRVGPSVVARFSGEQTAQRLKKILLALLAILFLGAQSPEMQKRLKRLERSHGLKKIKRKTKTKKNKKKSNVFVVKKKAPQKGILISRGESRKIVKHYDAWRKEKEALKQKAAKGSKEAEKELKRRSAIEVHLIRVAKIQSLYRYAKRAKNRALVGQSMILMNEENKRFQSEMEKFQ